MKAKSAATAPKADTSQGLGGAVDLYFERSACPTELCLHAIKIVALRKEFGGSSNEETGARLALLAGHFPGPYSEKDLGICRNIVLCLMHSPGGYQQMVAVRHLDIAVPGIDEVGFVAKRRDSDHALVAQDLEKCVGEHW